MAPNATAGASLVTGSVAVLATSLVAAAGLAGLAMRGDARARAARHDAAVGVGAAGRRLFAAGWDRRWPTQVQAFLDAAGTPLRNMHKLESVIRMPMVLGLAHLLGRIPLPGSAPRRCGCSAFAHPERDKRVAVGIVVLVALAAATSLAWTGRLTPPGAFDAIPQYWHDAADWLDEHNTDAGRVLVAPGRAVRHPGVGHQPRRTAAGARRQPVGGARLDSADPAGDHPRARFGAATVRRRAARPRAWPIPLPGKAFRMWWCATTWIPTPRARRARSWCTAPSTARRDCRRWRSSANRSGRARWRGSSPTAGCGPAIRRWRSTGSTAPRDPARPYLADTDAMARVDGGPEVLLRLDERRRLLGPAAAGPGAADRGRAARPGCPCPWSPSPTPRWRARPTTAGSTTTRRRSGRPATPGTPSTGCRTIPLPAPTPSTGVDRRADHGVELVVGFHRAAQRRTRDRPRRRDRRRLVDELGVQRTAVGGRPVAAGGLRPPGDQRHHHHHPSATAVGAQVRRIEVSTVNGTTTLRFDEAGKPLDRGAAVRRDPVGADHRGRPPTTDRPACSSASPTSPSPSTTRPDSPTRSTCATPWRCPGRRRVRRSRNGIWAPSCSAGRAARRAPTAMRCAASMALAPEEPVNFSRTLTVPRADVGDADGVGAGAAGPQAGRPDRRAGHHPGPRRRRPDRRPRLGVRRRRRRPGHRMDGAAAGGAAPDPADPDPEAARAAARWPACG